MLNGSLSILVRDLLVIRRSLVGELATTIASPLTFFMAFGLGLKDYILNVEGVPYVVFVAPGLVSMAIMNEAFDHGAWSMWFHRKIQATIDEYRVSPITTRDVVVGKLLSGFTIGLLKGSVVALIVFLLTGQAIGVGNLAPYCLFMLMGSILFSCAGTIVGTLCDQPSQLGRIQAVVVQPLIFLAGVFFPISSFPPAVAGWLKLLPTTALFEGSRAAFLRGTVDLGYLSLLTLSAVFAFWLAIELFDRYIEP
jgi:lipooligosaccharide transport system permease protein